MQIHLPTYFSLYIVFFASFSLHAQPAAFTKTPPAYEMEYIPMPEQNGKFTLYGMAEDKHGFIWMPTNCGLVCWDGQKTITYAANNNRFKLPLQDINFSYFTADKEGQLFNSQEGFNQFDPYRRSFKKINGIPAENLMVQDDNKFLFNDKGEFFLLVSNGLQQLATIFKQNGNNYQPVLTRHFEYRKDKFDFASVDNQFIYCKGDSFYIHDNDGKLKKKIYKPGSHFVAWSAYKSPLYSGIFFENNTKKIFALNKQTLDLDFFADLSFLPSPTVNKLYISDSLLWVAGNQQLLLINLASITYEDLSDALTEILKKHYPLNLSTIGANTFVCRNGNLYLWTENTVIRLRKKQPKAELYKENVIAKKQNATLSFRALAEDDNKNIYASYYSGIVKQVGGKGPFKELDFPLKSSVQDKGVYSLLYNNNTLYWNNVKLLLPSLSAAFMSGSQFAGHTTLLKDGDSIWIYPWLDNKIYVAPLHTGTARLVADFTTQGIDNMTDMVADPDGKHIWYSSPHFITKIDKKGNVIKSWSQEQLKELYGQVHCLYVKDNNLWFGYDKGLGSVNLKTYQIKLFNNPEVTPTGSLKDVVIFSMLPYQDSMLILGANMGIHLFSITEKSWYNLDKNHPLAQIEFNRSSTLQASNGKFYFGSIDGLFSFFPEQLSFIKSDTANRSLHLINISRYDQNKKQVIYEWENISNQSFITLAPHESNLELLFSVPDFENTIFYSYRIGEVNDQWQDYNTIGKVNIGNLTPGTYNIQVKASTSIDDKKPVYYNLQLLVNEHWYNTWWVKVLLLILIAGLAWWYVKKQIEKRLAQQQEVLQRQKELAALRTKISSDLHDDVGSILTGLSMQSQNLAMYADEKTKKELDEIVDMSRDAMERMRDTVWAIDSRKDKYINLIDRMRSLAEQQLTANNINHKFEVEVDDPDASIDPVRRQNIYLILKELIANILKHSNSTEILIRFTYKKNQLYLLVHDNGTQQNEKNTDGMGMSNIALRAKNIKGTFTIGYENGFKAELRIDD